MCFFVSGFLLSTSLLHMVSTSSLCLSGTQQERLAHVSLPFLTTLTSNLWTGLLTITPSYIFNSSLQLKTQKKKDSNHLSWKLLTYFLNWFPCLLSLGPSTLVPIWSFKMNDSLPDLKVKHQEPSFQIPPSVFLSSCSFPLSHCNWGCSWWQKIVSYKPKTLQFSSVTTQEN